MAKKIKRAAKKTPKKAAKKIAPKKRRASYRRGRSNRNNDDCFITTACVSYYGLTDNCEQLTVVRRFRDDTLLKTKMGRELVSMYYKLAPTIVDEIEMSGEQSKIYKKVYSKIELTCKAIHKGNNNLAIRIYSDIVNSLIKKFKLS
jgi:hypothetical protein